MKAGIALLVVARLAVAASVSFGESLSAESQGSSSLVQQRAVRGHGPETADLRIASKRLRYGNNMAKGQSETIVPYIYNDGPNTAKVPEVDNFLYPYLVKKPESLGWKVKSGPSSRADGWEIVTTLGDVEPHTMIQLSLSVPMTSEVSWVDRELSASVSSATKDARPQNNKATYWITPNHSNDNEEYWQVQARKRYNNNLPYGASETLSFLVFNDGPGIATQPILTAGFIHSMDQNKISWTGEQVWVHDGVGPSLDFGQHAWQPFGNLECSIASWDVVCNLPNMAPSTMFRVNITFPMNHVWSYKDNEAVATVSTHTVRESSSQAGAAEAVVKSDEYFITPNHNGESQEYRQEGDLSGLDPSSEGSASPLCLAGWLSSTPIRTANEAGGATLDILETAVCEKGNTIMGYNIKDGSLQPTIATDFVKSFSNNFVTLSFTIDNETAISYNVLPDTQLYVIPTQVKHGEEEFTLDYWILVRDVWVGAMLRATPYARRDLTVAYVTDLVWNLLLAHDPVYPGTCGDANVAAIKKALSSVAQGLMVLDEESAKGGKMLKQRTRPLKSSEMLPEGLPRRDNDGNWLIYLASFPAGCSSRTPRLIIKAKDFNRPGLDHLDRHQYPPAIASEAEKSLSVTYVKGGNDRRASVLMGYQFAEYSRAEQPDGHAPIQPNDRLRLAVIHRYMSHIEYLGDDDNFEEREIEW
ncbi:nuclease [Metarhizium rileyi]|uniref:Nuclease n=1 Tax=Metarhizium rileyi (strain RCEF 4871) TaxID=1649241 RepID=A0A167BPN0_METRR|nr:nuclease [Metarhizium rileyi RCEF 4871]